MAEKRWATAAAVAIALLSLGALACSCLTYNEEWDGFEWLVREDDCSGFTLFAQYYNEKVCTYFEDRRSERTCTEYDDVIGTDGEVLEQGEEAVDIFRAAQILVGVNVGVLFVLLVASCHYIYCGWKGAEPGRLFEPSCARPLAGLLFGGLCLSGAAISAMVSTQRIVQDFNFCSGEEPDNIVVSYGIGLHVALAVTAFFGALVALAPLVHKCCSRSESYASQSQKQPDESSAAFNEYY